MIRLSRLADYGIVVMCEMSAGRGETYSARVLSEKTNISETAVMKILKLLAKDGLVESVRGPKGGYMLVQEPSKINVLDIVRAIDGPVALTQCSDDEHEGCEYSTNCSAMQGLTRINNALQQTLQRFTLDQVAFGAMFVPAADSTQPQA